MPSCQENPLDTECPSVFQNHKQRLLKTLVKKSHPMLLCISLLVACLLSLSHGLWKLKSTLDFLVFCHINSLLDYIQCSRMSIPVFSGSEDTTTDHWRNRNVDLCEVLLKYRSLKTSCSEPLAFRCNKTESVRTMFYCVRLPRKDNVLKLVLVQTLNL